MGDEHIGQIFLFLEVPQQIEHLGLDGDVQRGDRLVTHNKFRIEGQSAGDADALAASAVHLVGIAVGKAPGDADGVHQFLHPLLQGLLVLFHLVQKQGLSNQGGDVHAGVQRGVGVLKDHLHLGPQFEELALTDLGDFLAVKPDFAAGGLLQAEHCFAQSGFAAARLTHDADGLACMDGEVHIVYRVQFSVGSTVVFLQVF